MCFIMCILQYAAKVQLFFYSRKRFQEKINIVPIYQIHWYYAIISRHTHRYSLMVCLQDHHRC